MPGIFRFKKFEVDQTGCAMKINTDGVLLGALTDADNPKTILDIGAGTGVIALMLAQRFTNACVDAVEIDEKAAHTAGRNFANSPFAERLNIYPVGFEQFFEQHPEQKYDLIVSNPPFYINSLLSPQKGRQVAKHAGKGFFEALVNNASGNLSDKGTFCLILPPDTAEIVRKIASMNDLFVSKQINLLSYRDSDPHREILFLSFARQKTKMQRFVIYDAPQIYSEEYCATLKDFFTIF
ncbi:MAG: methyltransferase [Bacteroidetes bacterium]|nr:methyltransferase [Bacteroidota bacterium]